MVFYFLLSAVARIYCKLSQQQIHLRLFKVMPTQIAISAFSVYDSAI